ncbi:hypothetical protein [Streptosporangium sp. NPDC002524]|uniref:hypothetical protein n=1 Tax=Streptosporangium sp. NPDC002524 TaxID=3154537 RepID=UPI00332B5258
MSDREKYQEALRKQQEAGELSPTPIPWRITTALDARKLYGPEVDRALGGEEPMVDQWESGELVPTPEQIVKLARLTGWPVGFFYRPLVAHERMTATVCRRTGPRSTRCQRVTLGPPEPVAPVIPIAQQPRPQTPALLSLRPAYWRCLIPGCRTRGRPQPAPTGPAAGATFASHYQDFHQAAEQNAAAPS